MVLVFDAEAPAERGEGEARHVPGREDVFAPSDAAEFVDDDPVVDLEANRLRQLGGGLDSEPRDDDVRLDLLPDPIVTEPRRRAATVSPVNTSTPRCR